MLVSEHFENVKFFFNDTATTEIYTLSLHDALPISPSSIRSGRLRRFLVGRMSEPGGFLPGKEAGPLDRLRAINASALNGPDYTLRDSTDADGVDEDTGLANDFGHTGNLATDHRGAAGHGLEVTQRKTLIETGEGIS